MALDRDEYKFKYNNPSSGLFKDQLNNEIEAVDQRDNVIDTSDGFLNLLSDQEKYFRQGNATGTDAYSVTVNSPNDAYSNGVVLLVGFANASTGPVTISVDAGINKKIFATADTQAAAATIPAGARILMRYDAALDEGAGGYLIIGGVTGSTSSIATEARGVWQYNNTIGPPPAAGRFRFDTLTIGAITNIYIYQISGESVDAGYFFSTLVVNDQVFIQQKTDATRWLRARVSALPTDNGTWWTIPVAIISSSGLMPLTGQDCIVRFTTAGGAATILAWTPTVAGVVEESLPAEIDAVVNAANTTAGTGTLSQARTASEIGLYNLLIKLFTTTRTWTVQQTFAIGSIVSDATPSMVAFFNASKKLVSQTPAQFRTWLGISGVYDVGNVSGSIVIDWNNGKQQKCVATGNITSLSYTNAVVGDTYVLTIVTNLAIRTVVFAGGNIWGWPSGTAAIPQLTDCTANGTSPAKSIDVFTFYCWEAGRLEVMYAPNLIPKP